MPLLFRKRGRRLPQAGLLVAPERVEPAERPQPRCRVAGAALPLLVDLGGGGACVGAGLVAVWDLPGLNANGDFSDEADGQPPIKVKIQERIGNVGVLPESGESPRSAVDAAAQAPGVSEAGGDESSAERDAHAEVVRRLEQSEQRLVELEGSERGAQEAVLILRRELMRLELDNSRLQASEQQLQEALESLRLGAQKIHMLEQMDAESKQLIDSLKDRVADLEAQQYRQYQYHQAQKLSMHSGYMVEDMMGYAQYPMYAPLPPHGHPLSDYSYTLPHPAHHQLQLQQLEEQQHQQHLEDQQRQMEEQHQQEEQHEPEQHQEEAEDELRLRDVPASSSRLRRKVRQCYNCQRFGHDAKQCKGQTVCLVCSGLGHSHKECISSQMLCANCAGAHRASSKECPARLAWTAGGLSPRA